MDRDSGRLSAATCSVSECDRPVARGGLCWGHIKARQRGSAPELGPPATEPVAPLERLREAAIDYREVDSEDDDAYRRADDRLRKAAKAYGRRGSGGRPPTVDTQRAAKLAHEVGIRPAARQLGVSPWAVWRAMRRVAKQFRNSR